MSIKYDLEQERQFDYSGLNQEQMVEHLANFVAGLWQIHPFREGNTRTTAIFTIKYLRSQGFEVNNGLFAEHSWYFRNALVRANYRNLKKNINYEPIFLVRFFRNLLMGENNTLKNRYMMINPPEEWKMPESEQVPDKYPTSTPTSIPTTTPTSSRNLIHTDNELIVRLVKVIGNKQLSIRQMLEGVDLKDRKNFIEYNLNPAITEGLVRMLYPDKPHHPRQKYLLTKKGVLLYNDMLTKTTK